LYALKDFFPNPRQHRLRFAYVCAWKHSGKLRVAELFVSATLDPRTHDVNSLRVMRADLS